MIKLYNTLSRKKEEFKPLEDKEVKIYTCGPTVYNYAHIGNLRAYIFADTLRRTLELYGYKVDQVVNITDVGHLTSDADDGEDKVEKEAKAEQKTPEEIAEFYTKVFLENLKDLDIKMPDKMPKATEHIDEMIKVNEEIEKNGYAYETEDGLYFDTFKLKDYGVLSKQKIELRGKSRVGETKGKKNQKDFALWLKAVGKHRNHLMQWDSPWGKGFPGWHIECTAMSEKYLGKIFDIHTGGVDHIPVHHENEIAQSKAAFGEFPAKFFMHCAFLVLGKEKMAKSKGNLITLGDLKKRGIDPLAFRFLCLRNHYRSQMIFDEDTLEEAEKSFSFLRSSIERIKNYKSENKIKEDTQVHFSQKINQAKEAIKNAFFDDLNIPKAIDELFSVTHYLNKLNLEGSLGKAQAFHAMHEIYQMADSVLGIGIKELVNQEMSMPDKVRLLVQEWRQAKKSKDFEKSDEIRAKAKEAGYLLEDLPGGEYRVIKK